MILGDNEYGLAEAAILSERWLSSTTLPDVLARPAVVTAAVEQPAPRQRKVLIRRRGPESPFEVHTNRPMSPTFQKSVEAVADLLNLPPGWNSYSAKPIAHAECRPSDPDCLENFLSRRRRHQQLCPECKGGIQLEWHTEGIDIEVYIDTPEEGYLLRRTYPIRPEL